MTVHPWRLAPGWAAATVGLSAMTGLALLATPPVLGAAVGAVTGPGTARHTAIWQPALAHLALLLAVSTAAAAGRTLCSGTYTAQVTRRLRRRAIATATDQEPGSLPAAGDLATRVLVDAQHPAAGLSIAISMVTSAVTLVVALASIALIDWRVLLAIVAGLGLLAGIIRRFISDTTPLVTAYREGQSEIAERLRQAQHGAASIRAHQTHRRETARVTAPLHRVRAAGLQMWSLQGRMAWRAGVIAPCLILVTAAVGGISLAQHRIDIGGLSALLGYAGLVVGALDGLEAAAGLSMVRSARERLAGLVRPTAARRAGTALPLGPVSLSLTEVGTTGTPARVSLEVPAGAGIAVAGPAHLTEMVARVAAGVESPVRGRVDVGGVPLPALGEDHRVVALATSRPALLGDSVAGLLGLGMPQPDRARIEAAARVARIHDVVAGLPGGYDTRLDELELSGGELQRLGIAQALLHCSGALVLDGATCSLDPATELEVLHAVAGAGRDRSLLICDARVAAAGAADTTVSLCDVVESFT